MEKNAELWENISFKTTLFHKNYDLVVNNENIITDMEGEISKLNIGKRKLPDLIGIYDLSSINLHIARLLNHDGVDAIGSRGYLWPNERLIESFSELHDLIVDKQINLNNYDKIILIHMLTISKKYRGLNVVNEFMEYVYRNHYNERVGIFAYVKPFQNNYIGKTDYLYGRKCKQDDKISTAHEHFLLNDFYDKTDYEINCYKLFSVANKCGFNRIDDNKNLFIFDPTKIIKYMKSKLTNKTNKSIV